MTGMIIVFCLLNVVTITFVYVGLLIAHKGRRDLIAGYRESKFKQPEKYGKLIGYSLLGSAVVNFAFSIGVVVFFQNPNIIAGYSWCIALPPILAAIYGNFKHRT
ncbi:hypothetical protein [Planctobacterium marinum]|uniref:DUF3784 domain-containing protein n=1 Tax=Planctobacterium marinum TaxID=1631968 RepID=A0AA48HLM2_9ALTE|nr:hypothetical protein MACH26_30300 [Planctobacterium marinum]